MNHYSDFAWMFLGALIWYIGGAVSMELFECAYWAWGAVLFVMVAAAFLGCLIRAFIGRSPWRQR
jgi:hypothetical protein